MARIDRILLPTDFSDLSVHAAGLARFLAEAHGAELHVVHVISTTNQQAVLSEFGSMPVGPPILDELAQARDALARFVREHLTGLASPLHFDVLVGRPPMEIARYAANARIDVIVIGSHADGILHRIIHGSTSKAVLENAPCAVLMVPLVTMKSTSQAPFHRPPRPTE